MLRRMVVASASVIALTSAAFAADIYVPSQGPVGYKDVPYIPIWAGFYVGANGGFGWSDGNEFKVDTFVTASGTDFRRITGRVDLDGGFGGGQAGYNWQSGPWVFGIETDIEGSGITGKMTQTQVVPIIGAAPVTRPGSVSANVDWFGTVRGRIGYAYGPALIYATGGFAYGGVQARFGFSDSVGNSGSVGNSSVETGWVAGGGIEYKFNPAWSVKAEYQFVDLGSITKSGPLNPPLPQYTMRGESDVNFNTVRVGLNYHFQEYVPLK